jgi:hypothetical protein
MSRVNRERIPIHQEIFQEWVLTVFHFRHGNHVTILHDAHHDDGINRRDVIHHQDGGTASGDMF